MSGLRYRRFENETHIPIHQHSRPKLNLLLSGELLEFTCDATGSIQCHHRIAPCVWRVPGGTSHSVRILNTTKLLSLPLFSFTSESNKAAPVAALLALSLSSAHACSFTEEDLAKAVDSNVRMEIPDCFFDNLAAAASGGNPEAQLDLGIIKVEGLDRRKESSTSEGFYWINRAINAGHPTAKYVLQGYEDDLLC